MPTIYDDEPTEVLERALRSPHMAPSAKTKIREVLRDRGALSLAPRSGKATVPEAVVRREGIEWLYNAGAALVVDAEQGYRPDNCPGCGASLGRGARTRILKGFPDAIAFWPDGGVWWIEFKSDVGTQTPDQLRFQRACEAAGETYVLARSTDDLEEVRRHQAGAEVPEKREH